MKRDSAKPQVLVKNDDAGLPVRRSARQKSEIRSSGKGHTGCPRHSPTDLRYAEGHDGNEGRCCLFVRRSAGAGAMETSDGITHNVDSLDDWSLDWTWFSPRKATLSPAPRKGASPLLEGRVRLPTTIGEDISRRGHQQDHRRMWG